MHAGNSHNAIFKRLPQGKELAPDHRLYSMLHDSPNPEMTAMVFREAMQTHIETWGNCYAEIEYDTDGFPMHLWPLNPAKMTVIRDDGVLTYLYRTPDGKDQRLSRRQVFHIPGIGWDGRRCCWQRHCRRARVPWDSKIPG